MINPHTADIQGKFHSKKNRLQYQRNHCSFKSSSLVQWNTPGLHCSHPPAPCALWDLTTPETAWRQRGSWEWEDEVTNRRWGREDGGREGSLSLSLSLQRNLTLSEPQLCTLSIDWVREARRHTQAHILWFKMHCLGFFFIAGESLLSVLKSKEQYKSHRRKKYQHHTSKN